MISAAVKSDIVEAKNRWFQDWGKWIEEDIIDLPPQHVPPPKVKSHSHSHNHGHGHSHGHGHQHGHDTNSPETHSNKQIFDADVEFLGEIDK